MEKRREDELRKSNNYNTEKRNTKPLFAEDSSTTIFRHPRRLKCVQPCQPLLHTVHEEKSFKTCAVINLMNCPYGSAASQGEKKTSLAN